jgi:hypothetical protein
VSGSPGLDPSLIQMVDKFDQILGIRNYRVQPGLLAATVLSPDGASTVVLGSSLLASSNSLARGLRLFILSLALGHEAVHVWVPQSPYRLLNELVAYPVGLVLGILLALAAPFVSFLVPAQSNKVSLGNSTTHFSLSLTSLIAASESQVRRFLKGVKEISAGGTPIKGTVYAEVDVASFLTPSSNPTKLAKEIQEALQVTLRLHRGAANDQLNVQVILYNKQQGTDFSPLEAALKRTISTNGLSVSFAGSALAAGPRMDAKSLVEAATGSPAASGAPIFVLSRDGHQLDGAKTIQTYNVVYLPFALFAYTHFSDAENRLSQIVSLFEKLILGRPLISLDTEMETQALTAIAA